ncbi:MAG TPA: tetratricopeptide repeat protein [Bacteroidales bacterium]|jgi:serine/threonine-protein kinase|nr:tetratricopeptide repeat protein [Bacteroidales bacterium]HNR42186.1 tetratricopeptide repeat protein [Bacteroidales bacterium]HQG76782.1 tetratricopeptide repeat protein [Bacteroidales bacterium]
MNRGIYAILFFMVFPGISGQTDNRDALVFYNHAMFLIGRKDYIGAIVNFTEAVRRDSLFLQAYENRGVARYYLNDYEGAIADYDRALKINPYDYNTYGRRGWAKFRLQQYSEAVIDFSKAIEGDRDHAGHYLIRGQAKFKLQDFEGAMVDFNRVLKPFFGTRDDKRNALFWRAMVKIELGQKESACRDLRESAKMKFKMAIELLDIYCPELTLPD